MSQSSRSAHVNACALCRREVPRLTRHHLIPRSRHKNKRNKKLFTREEVHRRVISLCPACHRQIHALFSEKELETTYNTLEKLQSMPQVQRFVEWIGQQRAGKRIKIRRGKQ